MGKVVGVAGPTLGAWAGDVTAVYMSGGGQTGERVSILALMWVVGRGCGSTEGTTVHKYWLKLSCSH